MRKESNIRPYPIPQALSRPSSLLAVGRDLSPRGHPDPSPLIVILIHSTSPRTRASEGSEPSHTRAEARLPTPYPVVIPSSPPALSS